MDGRLADLDSKIYKSKAEKSTQSWANLELTNQGDDESNNMFRTPCQDQKAPVGQPVDP